ncbi:MAG: hypothetical protein CL679_11695 [Bermanella sp.]|uniref:hypothetical protein n=1 Tax=uncultured Pseudoalteromonas sp. TaxID=114053 RepID=UPI000C9806E7|nr:hypothetical protein [uncultured Pseudoalteromonas sp.]MAA72373.1 hypothetical protein [Bermanella sp.]|tara:strand:+ start:2557 stop:2793 length:237 start_codon:yes stop_codon:yes gene_type:complete
MVITESKLKLFEKLIKSRLFSQKKFFYFFIKKQKVNKMTTLIDLLETPEGQDKLEKELDFFIRTNKKQHIKRFLGALK